MPEVVLGAQAQVHTKAEMRCWRKYHSVVYHQAYGVYRVVVYRPLRGKGAPLVVQYIIHAGPSHIAGFALPAGVKTCIQANAEYTVAAEHIGVFEFGVNVEIVVVETDTQWNAKPDAVVFEQVFVLQGYIGAEEVAEVNTREMPPVVYGRPAASAFWGRVAGLFFKSLYTAVCICNFQDTWFFDAIHRSAGIVRAAVLYGCSVRAFYLYLKHAAVAHVNGIGRYLCGALQNAQKQGYNR